MIRRALAAFAGTLLFACGPQTPEAVPPGAGPAVPTAPVAGPGAVAPDYSKLPDPSGTVRWTGPTPVRRELANGMPVYFLAQGPTPLVTMMLVFPRGSATDPKGKAGLTALTVDLLDEGAGGKSALELSEEMQRLGTDYGARAEVDHVLLVMNVIAESFEPSAKMFADIARRPALSYAEFSRRKDQLVADALAQESEPTYGRDVVMRKALFGNGYAGDIASGTRDTLKGLGFGEVKQHYARLIAPEGAALVVVGGIDEAPVMQALGAAFGDWKGNAAVKPAAVEEKAPTHGIYFVDYPGASQSALAVARRSEGEKSQDYFPAMVFSRAFGEAFTSRLNLNLREDKGYTYGARSSFERWQEVGYFGLRASVKAETTRPSVDEMVKELAGVCGPRPITEKERNEAVEGLLLGLPGQFERVTGVAAQLASLPLYDRPVDWFKTWPDKVQGVGVAAANAVAKKHCDAKDFVVVVAGDKKSVLPSLESLGLPISTYDAQGHKLGK